MSDDPATERYVNQQIHLFELKLKSEAFDKQFKENQEKYDRFHNWMVRIVCFVIGLALGIWIMLILLVHK